MPPKLGIDTPPIIPVQSASITRSQVGEQLGVPLPLLAGWGSSGWGVVGSCEEGGGGQMWWR